MVSRTSESSDQPHQHDQYYTSSMLRSWKISTHFHFDEIRATDAGLAYLSGLMKLTSIQAESKIAFTDADSAHLRQAAGA